MDRLGAGAAPKTSISEFETAWNYHNHSHSHSWIKLKHGGAQSDCCAQSRKVWCWVDTHTQVSRFCKKSPSTFCCHWTQRIQIPCLVLQIAEHIGARQCPPPIEHGCCQTFWHWWKEIWSDASRSPSPCILRAFWVSYTLATKSSARFANKRSQQWYHVMTLNGIINSSYTRCCKTIFCIAWWVVQCHNCQAIVPRETKSTPGQVCPDVQEH